MPRKTTSFDLNNYRKALDEFFTDEGKDQSGESGENLSGQAGWYLLYLKGPIQVEKYDKEMKATTTPFPTSSSEPPVTTSTSTTSYID